MTKRTDVHRPGALVPANYEHWNTYSLPASDMGVPIPPIGIDCAHPIPRYEGRNVVGYDVRTCPDTGRCCVVSTHRHALREGRAIFGGVGKCGVCGANYKYGSMFRHEPTGEVVHMGHECADKYSCMYDLSAWELENNRTRQALATQIKRAANERARADFLAAHEGLSADLELGKEDGTHGERILADLGRRFTQWCELSDKQVALARKLAGEIRNPASTRPVEVKVKAPLGKGIEFEGQIVSAKVHEGFRGAHVVKITVKVTTTEGVWLAWGTLPSSLIPEVRDLSTSVRDLYVGRRVRVKATLETPPPSEIGCDDAGRPIYRENDGSFVFMSRPSADYSDVHGCIYKVPKCIVGEPCRIVKKWMGGGEWAPMTCDGSCRNVAKAKKSRKSTSAAETETANR